MSDLLSHYKSLPRIQLQRELREITGMEKLHLWEFVGLGWIFNELRATRPLADRLGVQQDDVIGYRVLAGHVFGGAINDLMNVEADGPPFPDPFR